MIKRDISSKQLLEVASKQYKDCLPNFINDLRFLGRLDELLQAEGKGLKIHISSDGDSLVYKTANLTTKDLSKAVLDSCGKELSSNIGPLAAVKHLGEIPS